jgi:hypothetical protein
LASKQFLSNSRVNEWPPVIDPFPLFYVFPVPIQTPDFLVFEFAGQSRLNLLNWVVRNIAEITVNPMPQLNLLL